MAKNKRQKVKHYHRSFYSRETRVKRGIGIVVLVAAVLAAAWFAAPHVLDWATHTWYTVVKDRDLEAESASRAEAAASSAAQPGTQNLAMQDAFCATPRGFSGSPAMFLPRTPRPLSPSLSFRRSAGRR